MTGNDGSTDQTGGSSRSPRRDPFGAVLPDRTRDEDVTGWSEQEYDADEDLRREVPPHHG
ncbi:MAG: hypothetical protein ACRDOY_03860 [Nocardioidaceae bacterium]